MLSFDAGRVIDYPPESGVAWLPVPAIAEPQLEQRILTGAFAFADIIELKLPKSAYNHMTAKGRARRS